MSIETNNARDFVWAQLYRPTKVKDTILPAQTKEMLSAMIAKGNIPHLMFVGGPGMGKTTAARAITRELGGDAMFINASMENGIDVLRTKIQSFASTMSLGESNAPKIVILDECLHENETVRVGTVDDWAPVALKDLQRDVIYPVVSFNMTTGEFENDTGNIISDREDDIFEVTLASGKKVLANAKHPFICENEEGAFYERTIEEGLVGHRVVTA